jgi:hypothetical protein
LVRPAVEPYRPAIQSVHTPAPAREYLPAGHWLAVAEVDPAPHAYPAVHVPLHAAVDRPAVVPKVPAGQLVQTLAPVREYLPATHWVTVELVDAAGQV